MNKWLALCKSSASLARRASPVACRRAARFGATVLPPPGGRLGRPDGRAATARSAAGRSPDQFASSGRRSAPLRPRSAPRWRSLVEFVASAVGLRCAPAISAFGLNRGLAGRPRPRSRSPCDRSRRPHPRIPVRGFVAAEPAPRPARPSRRVRRTASARLSPLGARPSRPLLTQCSFCLPASPSSPSCRNPSRSGGVSRLWPGGADSRARGAKGSPVAFVFSLADAHSAEGNGLSRSID